MKFNYLFIYCLFFISSLSYAAVEFNPDNFSWKTGQIIGVSEVSFDASTFLFEIATGSRFGHVGIVYVDANNEVLVLESSPKDPKVATSKNGVKISKLQDFLDKSKVIEDGKEKYLTTVVEPKESINSARLLEETQKLIDADTRYNYQQYQQNEKSGMLNCSEFVYTIFKKLGIILSEPLTIKDLNFKAFQGVFKAMESTFPEKSTFMPPSAVMLSDKVKVLATNLPVDRVLSEMEILKAWWNLGGFDKITKMLIPASRIETDPVKFNEIKNELYKDLNSKASEKPYKETLAAPLTTLNCKGFFQLAR